MTTPQRKIPMVIEISSEQVPGPSRRQFCAHACQAASLVAVSALLPACGGSDGSSNPTNPSGPVEGNALVVLNGTASGRTVTVTASGALASVGGTALINAPIAAPNSFLAFRNSQTSVTVLTAVCTHEGCTVDHFNGQLYVCPCHGSKYTTGGSVANGPAARSLTQFPSTLTGDILTFTA